MSFGRFVLVRVARLYPLLIAATLLAVAYTTLNAVRSGGDLRSLALLPAVLLALPDPSGTFAPDPFPLLPVVWSLFFELLANFAYAFFVKRLSSRALVWVIALNALLLLAALAVHGNGELGNTYATLWAGVPRVLCSFLAGVLLFRLRLAGRLVSPEISPVILATILFALLAVGKNVPWLFDAACIFVLFPMLLIAAMNIEPSAGWTSAARFSADLSYPLYLLHLPLLHWLSFILSYFRVPEAIQQAFALAVVPALAYGAYVVFDRPVQQLLKSRLSQVQRPIDSTRDVPAVWSRRPDLNDPHRRN